MRTISDKFGFGLVGILTGSIVATLIMSSCTKQPYQSRHNSFCDCEVDYDGDKLKLHPPDSIEVAILDKILKKFNIPERAYKICKSKIPGSNGAFATNYNGRRYIIYDSEKAARTNRGLDYWGRAWTIGHELGHHFCNHMGDDEIDSHSSELEADRVAGSTLFLMGASLSQTTDVLSQFSERDSETHPGKERRVKAVTEGYYSAANKENYAAKPDTNVAPKPAPYIGVIAAPATTRLAFGNVKDDEEYAVCITQYRSAKIRASPDIKSSKIGEVPPGARVIVVKKGYNFGETDGIYADWWLILYNGKCGYCFSAYLQWLE